MVDWLFCCCSGPTHIYSADECRLCGGVTFADGLLRRERPAASCARNGGGVADLEVAAGWTRRAFADRVSGGLLSGVIQKAAGDYDGAVSSLRATIAQYPCDRVVLNQLGRILFLQRKYADAATVLKSGFDVDPGRFAGARRTIISAL